MHTREHCDTVLTHHAIARIRQRGVPTDTLTLLLNEADQGRPVGGGAVAESISRAKLDRLLHSGVPASLIERVAGLVVVVAADGCLMTVLTHTHRRRGRHYRGADRLSPRRRHHLRNRF